MPLFFALHDTVRIIFITTAIFLPRQDWQNNSNELPSVTHGEIDFAPWPAPHLLKMVPDNLAVGLTLLKSMPLFKTTSLQFWFLAGFLIVVFMTGGASRGDVQSLAVLIPLSIIATATAFFTLRSKRFQDHAPLIWGALAVFGLAALYAIPLPPNIWGGLPGRELTVEIENAVGLGEVWRPLSLSPANGWQAVASLFAPLAILLFGVQLDREERYHMLPLLISLGALSGILGLMQAAGGQEGALYFYEITNNGSAVGLFANRNHSATLLCCLFPMLVIFATRTATSGTQKTRQLIAAVVALVLVPLILVTGSRSGLLTAVIGLAGAALMYRPASAERRTPHGSSKFSLRWGLLISGLAVLSLAFLTIYFARAEAIDRLLMTGSDSDRRQDVWIVSRELFLAYFPMGFGSGNFVEAFKVVEPGHTLEANYLNRAHNDWLELAASFGVLGLFMAAAAAIYFFRQSFRIWRQMNGRRHSVMFARMAGIAIAIIVAASMSDYPLRTPIMMCIFALMLLWFNDAGGAEIRKSVEQHPDQSIGP